MRSLAVAGLVLLGACDGSSAADCSGVACGASPPAVNIMVTDARGGGVSTQVGITNLAVPPGVTDATASCGPPSTGPTTCQVSAYASGHYDLDIGATGYATQHFAIDVPSANPGPGVCCGIPYVPVHLNVALSP
ncbi:MAG TPA: hypothetical protein VFE90_19535 [Myxococcales bacterium]|jgi:hypothetical protein|nr:hypothetical protein [Myxococcales bacterium]